MRRILLIEDEEGSRTLWEKWHDGFHRDFHGQCSLATSATLADGVLKLNSERFDILILDLTVPPIGPDEMISWIFENSGKMPPIVVLTGDTDIETRQRCLMAGAEDYWVKPDAMAYRGMFFKSCYNVFLRRIYATYGPDKAKLLLSK